MNQAPTCLYGKNHNVWLFVWDIYAKTGDALLFIWFNVEQVVLRYVIDDVDNARQRRTAENWFCFTTYALVIVILLYAIIYHVVFLYY